MCAASLLSSCFEEEEEEEEEGEEEEMAITLDIAVAFRNSP